VTRLPVRWRLTLAFAAVMAILLAATGLFVHQQVEANLDNALGASLRSHAADVATLAQQADTGLADAAHAPALAAGLQLAQVVDARGHVMDATPGLPRRPLLDVAALARQRTGSLVVSRTHVHGGQPVRLLAVPVRAQGQRLVAIVGQSLAERDRAIAKLGNVLLVGGPVALLLASLAGLALTSAALRPVEAMRRRERRFVADASHELRSPLTMLRTELELIARDRPRGPQLAAATASAIEETSRLARLADDLLVLTRADSGHVALQRETITADALIQSAARRARLRHAKSGVRLVAVAEPDTPSVYADPDRISQALDNLLDNAFRHATTRIDLTARAIHAGVELHVCDDGPGFPPAFLPQAWDRFARADAARTDGGAGLGMSIVRTVAELHGGRAGAANRADRGADVWIVLPRPAGWARGATHRSAS
jgi:signal transduction histidine kinase